MLAVRKSKFRSIQLSFQRIFNQNRAFTIYNGDVTAWNRSNVKPIKGLVEAPKQNSTFEPYDVVVVGGGHAGCEG